MPIKSVYYFTRFFKTAYFDSKYFFIKFYFELKTFLLLNYFEFEIAGVIRSLNILLFVLLSLFYYLLFFFIIVNRIAYLAKRRTRLIRAVFLRCFYTLAAIRAARIPVLLLSYVLSLLTRSVIDTTRYYSFFVRISVTRRRTLYKRTTRYRYIEFRAETRLTPYS
jgi:hypothetical protein